MPLPFLAPGDLERCGLPGDGIEIANPLVAEESVLRTSLLPGLVKALATNAARRNTGVGLWEIGHVFRRPADGDEAEPLPDEREMLGVALGGATRPRRCRVVGRGRAARRADGVGRQRRGPRPAPDPVGRFVVAEGGVTVGAVGEVDPEVLDAHGIGERVGWLEVDLDALAELPRDPHVYRPVSVYPSSDVDLAFEVDDAVPAARRGHPRRRPASAWRRCACSTSTGAPASPPAAAAWPTPCGSRLPTTPSPTTRWPRCGGAASRRSRARSRRPCAADARPGCRARRPAALCHTLQRGDAAGAATALALPRRRRRGRASEWERSVRRRAHARAARAPPPGPRAGARRAAGRSGCSRSWCSTSTGCAAGSWGSTSSSPCPAT